MTFPDGLPTLTAGAHDPEAGEACVMEYVSVLAGEPWSDRPECTHPLLAHEARTANDLASDADRHRLVPLVGRLFGTSDDSVELRTRLRLAQAEQVLRLVEPGGRVTVRAHLDRARSLLERHDVDALDNAAQASEVAAAWEVARATPAREGALDPEHVDHHLAASRVMAFVSSPDLTAPEAWAVASLAVAHRVAAGECRADCGDGEARARRMVRDLGELLDVYDEVTGRVADPVPLRDARALAARL
jgi:hypothetical protein